MSKDTHHLSAVIVLAYTPRPRLVLFCVDLSGVEDLKKITEKKSLLVVHRPERACIDPTQNLMPSVKV